MLNDRQGEDACTRIKRRRERHWRDDPEPRQGTPLNGAGCLAFVPELRLVTWLGRFKPDVPIKYDGTTNPMEFL